MAKKYTVSVSDELGAKIDLWKKEVSPSVEFQKAMDKAISEKEGFKARLQEDATMDQVIERLRAEKINAERSYFRRGEEAGVKWAKAASYVHLSYAAKICMGDPAFFNKLLDNPTLSDYFHECFADDPTAELPTGYDIEYPREYPDEVVDWLDGWCSGVEQFWKEVFPQLNTRTT
jgi:hypothetical protein